MRKKTIKEFVYDVTDYTLYQNVKDILVNKNIDSDDIYTEAYKRFEKYGFSSDEAADLSEKLYMEIKNK